MRTIDLLDDSDDEESPAQRSQRINQENLDEQHRLMMFDRHMGLIPLIPQLDFNQLKVELRRLSPLTPPIVRFFRSPKKGLPHFHNEALDTAIYAHATLTHQEKMELLMYVTFDLEYGKYSHFLTQSPGLDFIRPHPMALDRFYHRFYKYHTFSADVERSVWESNLATQRIDMFDMMIYKKHNFPSLLTYVEWWLQKLTDQQEMINTYYHLKLVASKFDRGFFKRFNHELREMVELRLLEKGSLNGDAKAFLTKSHFDFFACASTPSNFVLSERRGQAFQEALAAKKEQLKNKIRHKLADDGYAMEAAPRLKIKMT